MNTPLVVLTNRYNLLEFLSSGMIEPRAGIEKYYEDLLALMPAGDVPLLRAPLATDVTEMVGAVAGEMAFPVALEVDTARLTTHPLDSLTAKGERKKRSLSSSEALGWIGGGPIPLSAVTKVHFRSQRELDEHLAREYENIPPDRVKLTVSPALFEGGTLEASALREWFGGLKADVSVAPSIYTQVDRARGARFLALTTTPGRADWLRDVVQAIRPNALSEPSGDANNMGRRVAKKAATKKSSASKAGSTSREGAPAWLLSGLEVLKNGVRSNGNDLETRLFVSALRVFLRVDRRERWRPLEVLTSIETEINSELGGGKSEELTKNLESIRLILNNDREFKPLNTGKGFNAAKALLMALLRPDASRLLSWSREQSGADDAVWSGAATLVGALVGYRALPTTVRQPGLDRYLEELAAVELRVGAESAWLGSPTAGAFDLEVAEKADNGVGSVRAVWRGEAVLEIKVAPPSLANRLLDVDFSSTAGAKLLMEVATLLGWTDCHRTTIGLSSAEFVVAPQGKTRGVTITASGKVEVSVSLDAERFHEKVGTDGIPPEREGVVLALLEQQPQLAE